MKCSNCKQEMEKGSLVNNGTKWVSTVDKPNKLIQLLIESIGVNVIAWKCSNCKKVELESN